MKILFLIFVSLAAVSVQSDLPNPFLVLQKFSWPSLKKYVSNCLEHYGVDPVVLHLTQKKSDNIFLNDQPSYEQNGCIKACVYRSFYLMKPDGSLNIEELTEDAGPEEKRALELNSATCRTKAGNDDCKFFVCLDEMDDY